MAQAAILGIDPGTQKCGFAVIEAPHTSPLAQGIIATTIFSQEIATLESRFDIHTIALGGGTHTAYIAELLKSITTLPIVIINEHATTLLARARYFEAFPPRGWRRLIPRGMLLPPVPIDDFAAILIAERYLETAKFRATQ